MKLVKVTEIVGETSGDGECFCFDELTEEQRERHTEKAFAMEEWPDGFDFDQGRTYPRALLPEQAIGQRGRWRITVEFEPNDGADAPAEHR